MGLRFYLQAVQDMNYRQLFASYATIIQSSCFRVRELNPVATEPDCCTANHINKTQFPDYLAQYQVEDTMHCGCLSDILYRPPQESQYASPGGH
jgi:hypothetical protein